MRTFTDEITLPETKPETEWIDGRAVQKVMPTREHSMMQTAFLLAIHAWGRGQTGAEWRFRVNVPDKAVHPLVPDVAFMSFERLRSLPKDERKYPIIAPEIAVEILSPDDKLKDVEAKRKEYLAWGVSLVLIVNYETQSMEAYDATGYHGTIGNVEDYAPPMFPDLKLPMRELFAEMDIPKE